MDKLLVIIGPTASGKTRLAVNLANQYNSEIISADSRQIYKGMDVGTGKDLNEYIINDNRIKYHLIDILDPSENYSVFQFKKDFFKVYDQIINRNKTVILCGGTGLYIESVLLNYKMPEVGADNSLREKLGKLDLQSLIKKLKKMDLKLFNIDFHVTKRRVIREIEIMKSTRKKSNNIDRIIQNSLVIGLVLEKETLHDKIKKRLAMRFNEGMIEEVKYLTDNGLSPNRLKYFGLEYKIIGEYLFDNLSLLDMKTKLHRAIKKFAKRQMTFFRRMSKRGIKIKWYSKGSYNEIKKITSKYLS